MSFADGKLTLAQQRARAWLPEDGSWRMGAGALTQALNNFALSWPGCVEMDVGRFGPRGGMLSRWRFTEKGVEINKAVKEAI